VALAERYRRPADLPPRIPVFPLRGAILLPRSTLPLNVFEPRYLAMLDDVMAGPRIIGIIQPQGGEGKGGEGRESPEGKSQGLRRVGCAGRVTSYQELDDGRLTIGITGIARFEVVGEAATETPYRIMSVSYDRFASDLSHGLGEEQVDRVKLLAALKDYLERSQLKADWSVIERASSEFLINALCVMSPYGPEEKQALLEAADLKSRAEVLVALAEMELAAQGGSGGTLQ
jgi:Lon protease-like protein